MYRWHEGWGAGHWVVAMVMMLVFWGFVVAGIVLLVRRGPWSPAERSRDSLTDAERILAERFARGEIDAEEFTARRDALRRR